MLYLVIGLGSMGTRRIRNLLALNNKTIWGIDSREDRRNEAKKKYGIETFKSIEDLPGLSKVSAFIISVPPDKHMYYANLAFENNIHCFIEASVVDEGMLELIKKQKSKPGIKICPSSTLRFHPSLQLLKKIIQSERIGKVSNFSYHVGQYLPDWHPWENMYDFYVSKKETGGCREIVPFELAWLNWVFGDIKELHGYYANTVGIGDEIDDVYATTLLYKNGIIGSLVVDVVARAAIRKLVVNGIKGQMIWDWDKKCLEVYYADDGRWVVYKEPEGNSAVGYNKNIIEEMYVREVKSFVSSINGTSVYENTLKDDYEILQYLYAIEKSCQLHQSIIFE